MNTRFPPGGVTLRNQRWGTVVSIFVIFRDTFEGLCRSRPSLSSELLPSELEVEFQPRAMVIFLSDGRVAALSESVIRSLFFQGYNLRNSRPDGHRSRLSLMHATTILAMSNTSVCRYGDISRDVNRCL
jgi:hypothetical protein